MLTRLPNHVISQIRLQDLSALSKSLFEQRRPQCWVVVADAGTGKSVLLRELQRLDPSARTTEIIDASGPANRTRLGIASSMLAGQTTELADQFLQMAAQARRTASAKLLRDALLCFEKCLTELSQSNRVIYFDNIDRAPTRTVMWLYELIAAKGGPQLLAAARTAEQLPSAFRQYPLAPFTFAQLEMISDHWATELGSNSTELAGRLQAMTQGNGVGVMLAVWALHNLGIGSGSNEESLDKLIWRMTRITSDTERIFWLNLIRCKHRLTTRLSELLAVGSGGANLYSQLSQFPFVSSLAGTVGGYVIHQIAAASLSRAFSFSDQELRDASGRIYHCYPRLMSPELDPGSIHALHLERLSYLGECDVLKATTELQSVFDTASRTRDLCRADDVAKIAEEILANEGVNSPIPLKLLVAETALLDNQAAQARAIIGKIKRRTLAYEGTAPQIRYHYNLARCSTCPAPIEGADIFQAVSQLRTALERGKGDSTKSCQDLTDAVRFELAFALRLIGKNHEAVEHYEVLAVEAIDPLLRIRSLEEQCQLYRLMQNLPAAQEALNRANAAHIEHQLGGMGLTTYFHANIWRDLNVFDKAHELYLRAETELIELGDDHALCELYGDHAWMKYLNDEVPVALEYLEKARRLAESYGFNRELSEYWHINYHLALDGGDVLGAHESLERAYNLAVQYGNIYMQLDCLMHLVQRAVGEERMEDSFGLIRKMEEIENAGAGIVVFRGRALVYQGDGLLKAGEHGKAYHAWRTGLQLVARYGNSRSNVELLGDLLKTRKEKFASLQEEIAGGEHWPDEKLAAELPELVKLLA